MASHAWPAMPSQNKLIADSFSQHLSAQQAEQLLLWEKLDAKMSKAWTNKHARLHRSIWAPQRCVEADEIRKPVIELCSRASFSQQRAKQWAKQYEAVAIGASGPQRPPAVFVR